ncbi:MAG: cation:proton antiporter [Solirubrobacteraceae bacterium]
MSRLRMIITIGLPIVLATIVAIGVFVAGGDRTPQSGVAGSYGVTGATCFGERFDLAQSGSFVDLTGPGGVDGQLKLDDGHLTGDVTCRDGSTQALDARVEGSIEPGGDARIRDADGRPVDPGADVMVPFGSFPVIMRATVGDARFSAALTTAAPKPGDHADDGKEPREFEAIIGSVFLAIVVVMLAARVFGSLAVRIGQARVMGEVLAGILLGPTLFGALLPEAQEWLFPADAIPYLKTISELGLVLFMFLVGLEIDLRQLKGRVAQTITVASASLVVPLAAGLLFALATFTLVGPPGDFAAYALFLAVAMSITAFPVLARILVERRMLHSPVGAMSVGSAAINDVIGWFLVALAIAVGGSGSTSTVLRTIALALVFSALMIGVVRLLLARAADIYDEAGRLPQTLTAIVFGGIILSAWITHEIGVSVIFGAFIMGAIMPRHAGLTEDVTRRMEDIVVLLLLPLFFVVTGLKTDIGMLGRPELLLLTVAAIVVAILAKGVGAALAARATGMDWQEASVLGTLMNARGLTELVVLTLALEIGAITPALFTALVVMALVTTFMTAPILRLIDPGNRFSATPEVVPAPLPTAVGTATPATPDRTIVVAPQAPHALERLRAVAEPLARSMPPRELLLVQTLAPARGATVRGALQSEQARVTAAAADLAGVARQLAADGVVARSSAFTSPDIGADLRRLAAPETVDLLLVDGHRPLVGDPVPRGAIGEALAEAPCDVAVLVARDDHRIALDPAPDCAPAVITVPFGAHPHDWGALELGAWIAAATGATLRLVGRAGDAHGGRDASRSLGTASLMVQRLVGIAAEPVLAEPGPTGMLDAARGSALLLVGLADDWRDQGLGPARTALARGADAPTIFVRRGPRGGALAPAGDETRFGWSVARTGSTVAAGTSGPEPAVGPSHGASSSVTATAERPAGDEQESGGTPPPPARDEDDADAG